MGIYIVERSVSEKHAGEYPEVKGYEDGKEAFNALAVIMAVVAEDLCAKKAVDGTCRSMYGTPQHEVHGCAVPESAKHHGDEEVPVVAQGSPSIAAEGYVNVVANPRRQRDVPASPEVCNAFGLVGSVEVERKSEAQKKGQPDGHVAVAAEVAVELNGITIQPQQVFNTRVKAWIVEYAVYEIEADVVGDDGFLEKAYENEVNASPEHVAGYSQGLANLRDKVARPYDGACYQLWKERHEESIVEQRGQRGEFAPIYVNGIAQALKGEKTDAHGQEDVPRLKLLSHDVGHNARKEIGIFEVDEQRKVGDDAQSQQGSCTETIVAVAAP